MHGHMKVEMYYDFFQNLYEWLGPLIFLHISRIILKAVEKFYGYTENKMTSHHDVSKQGNEGLIYTFSILKSNEKLDL
jgi:hypothetical protein